LGDKLILKQTIDQINKDLVLSGFEPILDTQKSLSHNIAFLQHFLQINYGGNLMKLKSFLYRIDLAESFTNELVNNDFEKLVYLVFNRVKKKVVFRAKNS
jgi:hypothetical protein